MYRVTKTFGHELGLSACFRQWRATSHCRFLHGYALAIQLTFESGSLDLRNWVVDFGGFEGIKRMLRHYFDHKLLIASDDPLREELCELAGLGAADPIMLPAVGCEAFARLVFEQASQWLAENPPGNGARLVSVDVREHGSNGASYSEGQA